MRPLKVLFYGPPGVGKTTLAATSIFVPEYRPVLMFSFENSITPIHEICRDITDWQKTSIDPEKVNIINISNWKQMLDLWETNEGKEYLRQFKCFIFDSMTNANERVVNYMVNREGLTPSKIASPEFKHWNASFNIMKDLVWALQEDYNASYILICHPKESESDVRKYPSFQGDKLGYIITGIVDHVGFMDVDTQGKVTINFANSLKAFAKKRKASSFDLSTGTLSVDANPVSLSGIITVPQICEALNLV